MSDLPTALAKIAELEAKNVELEARVKTLEDCEAKRKYQTWRGEKDNAQAAQERDGVHG